MKLKKISIMALACAVSLGFLGCGEDKTQEVYKVKFAHVVSANTPKGQAADFFAKRVDELSNGKIKVEVFPSAQLVDDDKVFQELTRNNVQMAAPSFSKFTPIAKEFNVWDVPFLFRDTEHLHKVMDSEVGQILKDVVSRKGIVALDYWDAGFKQFSTNKKPIVLPEDAKGQKMRIMSSKVLEEQTKAIGAIPQVLPFGEVYSALSTGVVDAAENPLSNLYNSKFYEVQRSITLSNHGYLGYLVVVSDGFWKQLSDNLKEIFKQALHEATEFERKESEKEEKVLLEKLKKDDTSKTEVITLAPEQVSVWKETMQAIYPKFYDIVSQDLIEKIIQVQ
ncbi:DctP family TRAP transporter solute-binding subunit [Helicobacter cinaedi]|uniref:C4-dicarboxylate-binding periplasmic protein n=2 Tax=Helicobacter cinaedi CCUG 18818 = ATCC BAA-847 TaxID=537971 RepID=A0AAI8MML4_9HELI|nr:DctP family TRAP transporter solute-binding subunit [Helicobacter cinaedi]QOQ91638.1 DctP family TRAP transporter solute-binding subunit [Helicobacter cinaedi]BAM32301.1 C4-dicarboxylate-binding periplasmic protein [Helicobacter cinaedi CCUG 18818 = ATCC BAA-847]